MKDLIKGALSDEKGHQSSARWGALGIFSLIYVVLFIWFFAALFGNKAMSSDAIKLIGVFATTFATILGAAQLKSAAVGVSQSVTVNAPPPTDKAKVSLQTAKAAMLLAKAQQAPPSTDPTNKLKPPSMGGDGS